MKKNRKRLEMFIERLVESSKVRIPVKTISIDEQIQIRKEENNRLSEIISNYDYVNWLLEFTKKNKLFFSDGNKININELSENDRKMVNDLRLFFLAVLNYVEMNNLKVDFNDYVESFVIEYKNVYFELFGSHVIGYGIERLDDDKKHYIPFDAILEKGIVRKRY